MFFHTLSVTILLAFSASSVFGSESGITRARKMNEEKIQGVNLDYIWVEANPNDSPPFGACRGHCDSDADCEEGLMCFQREASETVPGCRGGEQDQTASNYCIYGAFRITNAPNVPWVDANPEFSTPFGVCHGHCTSNNDCEEGLMCFQREAFDAVPGCAGGEQDQTASNYCIYEAIGVTNAPTDPWVDANPDFSTPFGVCQGHCTSDNDCEEGLSCFERAAFDAVPGCAGGDQDQTASNYCVFEAADQADSLTASPSTSPSASPSQSAAPSSIPSDTPSSAPSTVPSMSARPSSSPSTTPSLIPSDTPSTAPSVSLKPSSLPSDTPSSAPSTKPSSQPSAQPSSSPSTTPSLIPSDTPSTAPSTKPSSQPSTQPSYIPTTTPSSLPSDAPSTAPSTKPSSQPSAQPSVSLQPSSEPSYSPTTVPSSLPSDAPSTAPSISPSYSPTTTPSSLPSDAPSTAPSAQPSEDFFRNGVLSTSPTGSPSATPTAAPYKLNFPTAHPSSSPTSYENFCGSDAGDALKCGTPCESGQSSDCPAGEFCYAGIPCPAVPSSTPPPAVSPSTPPPANNYCGLKGKWADAKKCNTPCPLGRDFECPAGESCFASITCETTGNYCGAGNWSDAKKCQQPCPGGVDSECPEGETCYANIPCPV